ncbi:hypothetical protein F2Q70_00009632 [Brassica cretica]|uniref:FH2 domain-containing protein n=1 Tax=Brassica cretica TaxID=69181 RepID=A0A8S9M340_BRACR|nr:hypothetical protein F2Q70_00009632 [Brassica cretica]
MVWKSGDLILLNPNISRAQWLDLLLRIIFTFVDVYHSSDEGFMAGHKHRQVKGAFTHVVVSAACGIGFVVCVVGAFCLYARRRKKKNGKTPSFQSSTRKVSINPSHSLGDDLEKQSSVSVKEVRETEKDVNDNKGVLLEEDVKTSVETEILSDSDNASNYSTKEIVSVHENNDDEQTVDSVSGPTLPSTPPPLRPPPPPPPPSQQPQATNKTPPPPLSLDFSQRRPLGKNGAPLPKLKPLHWDKVRATPNRTMVWDRLRASSFEFDEEMIESLFGYTMQSSTKNEEGKCKTPSPGKHLLEPKRLQNFTILLKALNANADQICSALGKGEGLCLQQLEALVKMVPTKEEELKLCSYKGEVDELGSAEKFLRAVVGVPFAFQRAEAMLYRETFEDEVVHLRNSFSMLEVL